MEKIKCIFCSKNFRGMTDKEDTCSDCLKKIIQQDNPKIEYYNVRIYGTDMKYIKDEEKAKYIFMLTGRKTLSSNDVIALAGLGYHLTEVVRTMEDRPHN